MVMQVRLQELPATFAVSLNTPQKLFFKDLAEMKPVDREGNGLRKKAGTADDSPKQ